MGRTGWRRRGIVGFGHRDEDALPRWRAGDRFASSTLGSTLATSPIAGVLVILVGLAASWVATYLLGGARQVVPHFYYVPILFAAVRFGPVAALVTALASGVLAGPLTYLDVATQTPQESARWLTRTVFFTTIGVGMAALVRPALPSVSAGIRRVRDARVLREALAAGELFVRYQPIVWLNTRNLYGVEALVRWKHPQRGELGPGEFLDAAETSGAIRELDMFVFEQACRQAVRWHALAEHSGRVPPRVSVNLSRSNLEAPDLIGRLRDTLESTGADPSQICLELTESLLIDDFEVSVARLARLKTLGLRLAIDDFGTGYSSLAALDRFPIDVLKIDRTFLDRVTSSADASNLLGGIALLARSLEVTAIAEGVETVEQREVLTTNLDSRVAAVQRASVGFRLAA
ncbi:MAG: EAL domain-containing protein [Nitriliruptor sp.]|nr:MAG: EAL domain-containing protein [Nitriliruptor sp.]